MGIVALENELTRHRVVLLDTMVFSYHFLAHPRYLPLTTVLLSAVEAGRVNALMTTMTLAELLTRPAQEHRFKALQDYEVYLRNFPNLTLVPLDCLLARETALTRAATRLRMPDAVQIAAARLYHADAIVTNDHAWRGKFDQPGVIILDDYLEE